MDLPSELPPWYIDMGDINHLVYAILKFLEEQQMHSNLDQDAVESLEVASQCLESAFGVSPQDPANAARYQLPAPLLEIFVAGVNMKSEAPRPKASIEDKAEADSMKGQGNELMKQEKYKEALGSYTQAIEKDGHNAVYFCNRAAAFSKLNEHEKAIEDCISAIKIDPTYSKAYGRKGLAHTALNEHRLSRECYDEALKLEPDNESYKNNLELAEQKIREEAMGGGFNAGMAGPAGLNLGGMDFSSVLNNPALMNMATNMLSNPQMQQMMSNLMSGGAGGGAGEQGMGGLLQAGQHLAQQMQQDNPDLVDQLRTQMGRGGGPALEDGDDGAPPPGTS